MAFIIGNLLPKNLIKLEEKLLSITIPTLINQKREWASLNPPPRLRNPTWFTKKNRTPFNEDITKENHVFLSEVIDDKCKLEAELSKQKVIEATEAEWQPQLRRCGVIARKIGIYPMWLKNGKKISTTLLEVLDNHVIKYYTAEEYTTPRMTGPPVRNKKSVLLVGAESSDPTLFTKEYCGIFKDSGVLPKKYLSRFYISPEAAIPPGTPLGILHFQVGNYIDVRGKTIDRGFQGVMKRHGFSGMPASHGVTKTHRRGGNIGGGGEKARVWPGQKMPGHMGNRYRIQRGLKIWRINTKYNVMWVSGQAIAGETNSIVTIYDTLLPLRKPSKPVPFPTLLGAHDVSEYPENIYDEEIHVFDAPSIEYNES